MADLIKKFQFQEILDQNSLTKTVILLGTVDGEYAIATLQKLPFSTEEGSSFFQDLGLDQVKHLELNDVYSWNLATIKQDIEDAPSAKVNLIYPATETHIAKYRAQPRRIINETPQMYKDIVVPYIETMKGDRIKWVYNILHRGAEADRVIYRNDDPENGFLLLPDMKWDRKDLKSLYLVTLVLREDLSSIRDLNESHIPFLQNVKREIQSAVYENFGLGPSELKLYFHYQPSYYHLHIHVANVAHEQLDFGKSILIDNVIEQLKFLGPEGFQNMTLSYLIGEGHQLWKNGLSNYA